MKAKGEVECVAFPPLQIIFLTNPHFWHKTRTVTQTVNTPWNRVPISDLTALRDNIKTKLFYFTQTFGCYLGRDLARFKPNYLGDLSPFCLFIHSVL